MEYLAHSVSFQLIMDIAPSIAGTKQIGYHDLSLLVLGAGERRDQVDQPYLIPIRPFFQRQTVFRLNHPPFQFRYRLRLAFGP